MLRFGSPVPRRSVTRPSLWQSISRQGGGRRSRSVTKPHVSTSKTTQPLRLMRLPSLHPEASTNRTKHQMSTPSDAVAAVIDSMIAGGASDEHVSIQQGESLRYDSATGEVTGTAVAGRIPDNGGRDIASETAKVHERVNALQSQLAEQNYDAKTGKPTGYKINDPAQRDLLTAQYHRALESAQLDLLNLAKLEAQRDGDRIAQEAKVNEDLAIKSFSNGDPVRAKAIEEALLRASADEAAKAIVNARRVGRQNGLR